VVSGKISWPIERADYGCVRWLGRFDASGYGRHGPKLAHPIAYVDALGPVPPGLVLDHICRRTWCVAYWHLEPVTPSVNEYRKGWAFRARIKLCPFGHDLAINQALTPEGGRTCRTCNRQHAQENRP
jgi:hypothetical protein